MTQSMAKPSPIYDTMEIYEDSANNAGTSGVGQSGQNQLGVGNSNMNSMSNNAFRSEKVKSSMRKIDYNKINAGPDNGKNGVGGGGVHASEESMRDLKGLIRLANDKLKLLINNESIVKSHSVVVQLYLVFLRVGEIDNLKERFQAEAYFEACWEDNTIDPKDKFDPRRHWDPELFIQNAVGNLKQDIKYKIERVDNRTMIYEMRMIKGVFWERLELWDFPLGKQTFTLFNSQAHTYIRIFITVGYGL